MKRESCRSVIFKEDKVLLIYREREEEKYYVFPGGKIENNETREECIVREIKEEIGITIKVLNYIYKVEGEDFIQHFYLCEWIDGKIGTGDETEYDKKRKGGIQVPMLIDIKELSILNIVSEPIVKQLINDLDKYGNTLNPNLIDIIE